MRFYNYIQAWFLSFFSRELYQNVGRVWKGTGSFYLFTLILITWSVGAFELNHELKRFVDKIAPPIVAQIPDMKLQQGQLSSEVVMPYTIKWPTTGKPLAVIDVTGKITNLEQAQAPILITKKDVIYTTSPGKVTTYSLAQLPNMHITKEKTAAVLQVIKQKALFYILPLVVMGAFLMRILQVLLFSVFAIICAKQLGVELAYKSLFRVTAVAMTPLIILGFIQNLVNTALPFESLVFFFLGIVYVYFAVRANKQATPVATS